MLAMRVRERWGGADPQGEYSGAHKPGTPLQQQISEPLKRRGQPASGLLTHSRYFLFKHRISLRDILPSIYHIQKKFRCSASLRDEGLGSKMYSIQYVPLHWCTGFSIRL
ncbi:hypothetical protein Q5P01_020359 [Channa striata]|uniref:Uncharacterized protein n=1 Tax=Channa striata TaxID=64152 RepID=A0AA88LY90_CHASR|nr:hypothetical protein Q5P01_020359 [Channa striata]